MLKTMKKLLQRVLYQPTDLENFIASKNIKCAGDLEHWMRVYAQQRNGGHYGF
jgi:hypothetical protein